MAIGFLSPVAIQQFFDANGNPLAGGKLYSYVAGTDVPVAVYSDVGLTIPLANPIVLDAAGRAPEIFIDAQSYKFVLTSAADVTIWTADNAMSPFAVRSTQGSSSLTGLQHNVPVPQGVVTYLTMANAAPVTITGFSGGTLGQVLIVRAGALAPVFLQDYSQLPPTSAVGNQLINFVRSGVTALAGTGGMALYIYVLHQNVPFWFLVTHEQGASIRVPYSAGNFIPSGGSAGQAWTVEAPDILAHDYLLKGSTVTITVQVRNTSVAGLPQFLVVGGFPYTNRLANANAGVNQYGTGTLEPCVFFTQKDLSLAAFGKQSGTFADATNTLNVFGQVSADVL